MAEMLLCDHLEELWMLIEQQHLLYLISDESPGKLEQRKKLENYIKDYLYVAPHNRKFTFPQTAEVLHRSVSTKENFSGHKAASAWKAIGKYADNLVVQPWRKEFKDVKLYCGFYKHEVEENLADAELMFEAMGFCNAGNSTMTITDILDPDRITSVSKDAIVASVECQILKQIWDSLSPHYNFTWLEILEFRENHTGTPDQAIRALRYKRRQRQYEEQMCRRAQYHHTSESHARPDYSYVPNVGYYNHMHYPGHSYSFPVQSRYASINVQHIVSPSSIYPPPLHSPYTPPHLMKPQDLYQPNGFHLHHYPPQMGSQSMPDGYANYHPHQSASVPTGQLIELDSAPVQHSSESYAERSAGRYPENEVSPKWEELDKNGETTLPSAKAKEDGFGSWETWDYVYRNLESQGYKKNHSSRADVVNTKGNVSPRNNDAADGKVQGDLVEKMRKMNVSKLETSSKDASENDGESKSKGSSSRKVSSVSLEVGREQQVPDSRGTATSPEKVKRTSPTAVANPRSISQKKDSEVEPEYVKERKSSLRATAFEAEAKDKEKDGEEKWECITCTYLNGKDRKVCEMCSRSKERGNESKPQPSGGQECRDCTLVNERGLNFCAACGGALKDSPTYI